MSHLICFDIIFEISIYLLLTNFVIKIHSMLRMVFLSIFHNNLAIKTASILSIPERMNLPYFLPVYYPVVRSLKFIIFQLASWCSSRYNRSLWMDYLVFITYIIKKIYNNEPIYQRIIFFATFFAKKSTIFRRKK